MSWMTLSAQAQPQDVQTQLPYLARDELYVREKPFGADFPVDHFPGSQFANHIFEVHDVTVHDVRGTEPPSLERNGFCFLKAKTSLTAAEASTSQTPAVTAFFEEIEQVLYERFPGYSRIEVMDFQVSCPAR